MVLENTELKKTVDRLELEKAELKEIVSKDKNPGKQMLKDENEFNELREVSFDYWFILFMRLFRVFILNYYTLIQLYNYALIFTYIHYIYSTMRNFQDVLIFYKKENVSY